MSSKEKYLEFIKSLPEKVTLIAVSKTKSKEEIQELYNLGHRDFGENYVQELLQKKEQLPADIRWHFIGHLQTNKVKSIVPFVHMIQSADSIKLIHEINKTAQKNNRIVKCLLQVHVAEEQTKFGFSESDLESIQKSGRLKEFSHVNISGVMGMATNTDNVTQIKGEFQQLKQLSERLCALKIIPQNYILSMGMSSDYKLAIEEGSTMIRIGSLIFGQRSYSK